MSRLNMRLIFACAALFAPICAKGAGNYRDFVKDVPTSQAFTYESPDSVVDISLRFEISSPLEAEPSIIEIPDPFAGMTVVELFDRFTLAPGSELRVGGKVYPLRCLRVRGKGQVLDAQWLPNAELFFPVDDPDGKCFGPLNPDYPAPRTNRYRWNKYLKVSWNGQDKQITSAQLIINDMPFNLAPKQD
jgi:hypothetical protein